MMTAKALLLLVSLFDTEKRSGRVIPDIVVRQDASMERMPGLYGGQWERETNYGLQAPAALQQS